MHPALTIVIAALVMCAGMTALYFSVALIRIRRALTSVPLAFKGVAMARKMDALPSVCVIVPAHNEARVIERVAQSLLKVNYPDWRAVFALDRCTDDTRAIIERVTQGDARIEILEIESCPDDWAGKTNALRTAVEQSAHAKGAERLLFLDADTEIHPDCIHAAVGLMHTRNLDLVSFLSTLSREHWFERIVQPMAVLELLREHPLDRVNRKERPSSFANGQFLLFNHERYVALGGHERVKDDLLEDIAFARALKADDGRWGVFIAGEMLRCRMYGDWQAFRRGWKRIFIESTHKRPKRLRRYARQMRVVYSALPVLSVVAIAVGCVAVATTGAAAGWMACILGAFAVALWFAANVIVSLSQGATFFSALVSPVGAWLLGGILREAAEDLEQNRGVSWGGRVYTNLMDQSDEAPPQRV